MVACDRAADHGGLTFGADNGRNGWKADIAPNRRMLQSEQMNDGRPAPSRIQTLQYFVLTLAEFAVAEGALFSVPSRYETLFDLLTFMVLLARS